MKKNPHQSQIPNNMIPARYPSRLMGRYSISSRLIHLGLAISSILNAPSSWAAPKSKNPSSDSISKLPIAKPPETIILKDGDRVTLTAAPVREKIKGKWMRRFAYNGMIPGPKFIATEKTKIQLTLVNEIGIPTTLHSHGLRGTDRNDGVVGIGQGPILNHESFTYDLVFPDTGLFWYHPHLTEELTQEMGLQGTYLVIPKEANATLSPPRHEIIVLDDLLVEGGKLPHFTHGETSYALMGRYGNHLLVNNQMANNQYAAKMTASANEVMRFYIVNTANARPFRISMSNAQMKVVGGDNGFYEKEFLADELIISPAERLIVDVKFLNPGVASLSHRSTKIRTPLLTRRGRNPVCTSGLLGAGPTLIFKSGVRILVDR